MSHSSKLIFLYFSKTNKTPSLDLKFFASYFITKYAPQTISAKKQFLLIRFSSIGKRSFKSYKKIHNSIKKKFQRFRNVMRVNNSSRKTLRERHYLQIGYYSVYFWKIATNILCERNKLYRKFVGHKEKLLISSQYILFIRSNVLNFFRTVGKFYNARKTSLPQSCFQFLSHRVNITFLFESTKPRFRNFAQVVAIKWLVSMAE